MNTKPTAEELKVILEKHQEWLNNEPGGERADLRSADLRSADLRYADLRYADLSGSNLHYADLSGSNLRSADLSGSNLHYADLSGSNLRSADLRSADLSGSNLHYAALGGAEFSIRILSFGPFGTLRQMTIYRPAADEVRSGCWKGTLEEFRAKVAGKFIEMSEMRMLFEAGIKLFEAGEAAERLDPRPDSEYKPEEKS